METYTIGFRPYFCVCPVSSCFTSVSLQLHVVDSTQVWRELSCLLVTLETTAAHGLVCTLWSCPKITVSKGRAVYYYFWMLFLADSKLFMSACVSSYECLIKIQIALIRLR